MTEDNDKNIDILMGTGLEFDPNAEDSVDVELLSDDGSWLYVSRNPRAYAEQAIDLLDAVEPDMGSEAGIDLDADLDMTPEARPVPEADAAQEEPKEPRLSEKELAALLAQRRKNQKTLIIVAVIAWVCVAFTFMYVNGWGPFSHKGGGTGPGNIIEDDGDDTGDGDGSGQKSYLEEPVTVKEWVTAGEGYKNLWKLISEQTADVSASAPGSGLEALGPLEMEEDAPPMPGSAGSGYYEQPPEQQGDYSETNEQVAGVHEADIVKTDGEYIYCVNSKNLVIAKQKGGELEYVSRVPQPTKESDQAYFEIYVAGDRLLAIRHGYDPAEKDNNNFVVKTSVDIFDISNRAAPMMVHTLTQSGEYNSSRMVGGHLYLVSNYYVDVYRIEKNDLRTFVPLFESDWIESVPPESDIYLPPGTAWPSYTVISGIDAVGTGEFVSQKAVYGDAGSIYMSPNAVYLAHTISNVIDSPENDYSVFTSWTETLVMKLAADAGNIKPWAQARVPGYILAQQFLDEYEGVFRLVATKDYSSWYGFKDTTKMYSAEDWAKLPAGETTQINAAYTLDQDLNLLGAIDELAPGERIYSCRFIGGMAYIVTFRQTNPVFSLDISQPVTPRVVGETSAQGFSEYLHPYKEGRLFGFGRDADPDTGRSLGIKLTMFDTSDPANVGERHTLSVGEPYSSAEYNHKAILVSAEKSLVAFPVQSKYLVYKYDDAAGFEKVAEVKFADSNFWSEIRGLFIGAYFFAVGPNHINAYKASEAFAEKASLRIDEGASSVSRWKFGPPGEISAFDD